jgi:hypothetical protein
MHSVIDFEEQRPNPLLRSLHECDQRLWICSHGQLGRQFRSWSQHERSSYLYKTRSRGCAMALMYYVYFFASVVKPETVKIIIFV